MRKMFFVGAVALVAMLPVAAPAAPSPIATIAGSQEYGADHLLVGIEEDLANCGGTAPATTECDTGTHLRAGGGFFGPGTGEGCPNACSTTLPGYTGTLKMNIIYLVHPAGPNQVRTNTCNFSNGVVLSCIVTGAAPPAYPVAGGLLQSAGVGFVTAYDHTCQSFNLGTTTPGGSGPWMCFAWHGLLT